MDTQEIIREKFITHENFIGLLDSKFKSEVVYTDIDYLTHLVLCTAVVNEEGLVYIIKSIYYPSLDSFESFHHMTINYDVYKAIGGILHD